MGYNLCVELRIAYQLIAQISRCVCSQTIAMDYRATAKPSNRRARVMKMQLIEPINTDIYYDERIIDLND